MKAADVFVFYDDVQFTSNTSRSFFFARVQLKTGRRPALALRAGPQEWPLRPADRRDGDPGTMMAGAPLRGHPGRVPACPLRRPDEPLLTTLGGRAWARLADLTVTTTLQMAELFGLTRRTLRASATNIGGTGTERVLAGLDRLGSTGYVTGSRRARLP